MLSVSSVMWRGREVLSEIEGLGDGDKDRIKAADYQFADALGTLVAAGLETGVPRSDLIEILRGQLQRSEKAGQALGLGDQRGCSECLFMHEAADFRAATIRPLSEIIRKLRSDPHTAACDPTRTFSREICCNALYSTAFDDVVGCGFRLEERARETTRIYRASQRCCSVVGRGQRRRFAQAPAHRSSQRDHQSRQFAAQCLRTGFE
jgi:hypothetical protein